MANSPTLTSFSSGVVEISAVATLIGAPIVEAMTLGLKSAACLPWASISSFGLLHVAKASLAAAVPDWSRESLGLQNENADAALGLCLELEMCTHGKQQKQRQRQVRSRVDLGDVKGVSVTRTRNQGSAAEASAGERPLCVYQLDRASRLVLDTISSSEPGKHIPIHEFMVDPAGNHKAWKDWLTVLLSLGKVLEIIALWLCEAEPLLLVFTALPWAYGFACGMVLVACKRSRDQHSAAQKDLVVGELPSPLHQGGHGKILLGMPKNSRRSRGWTATWALYAPITMIGVAGTFVVLGRNNAKSVYLWMAFQAWWLLMRTVVFFLVESAAGTRQSLTVGRAWEIASTEMKQRTTALLLTLSRQQASSHPRGVAQYVDDLLDQAVLQQRFEEVGWLLSDYIEVENRSLLRPIRIVDVVGDTVLRSFSWMMGANLDNNEMYDSALAFLKVTGRCIAVPCVRVSQCRCKRVESKDWPRGDSHGEVCKRIFWMLWIPLQTTEAGEILWMQAEGPKIKGDLELQCLTKTQLDKSLAGGKFYVSFKTVGELEPVLQVSRKASQVLMSMILGVASAGSSVQLKERV